MPIGHAGAYQVSSGLGYATLAKGLGRTRAFNCAGRASRSSADGPRGKKGRLGVGDGTELKGVVTNGGQLEMLNNGEGCGRWTHAVVHPSQETSSSGSAMAVRLTHQKPPSWTLIMGIFRCDIMIVLFHESRNPDSSACSTISLPLARVSRLLCFSSTYYITSSNIRHAPALPAASRVTFSAITPEGQTPDVHLDILIDHFLLQSLLPYYDYVTCR